MSAEEKPTVEIASVPDWAVKMTERFLERMNAGFSTVEDRLTSQDTKLDKAITEGIEANVRLDRVETRLGKAEGRLDTFEERVGRTSTGVRGLSQVDAEHEAKLGLALADLADEKAKREKLEAESATKADLKKVADAQTTDIVLSLEAVATRNKTVRMLLIALAALAFLAMNAATNYLTRGSPAQQPATTIQVNK